MRPQAGRGIRPQSQVSSRLTAGGRWIRTFGTAARKLRGTHIQNDEQRRISYCRGSDAQLFACDGATDALAG